MIESGDSDLIDKKMNISRYIAYRSEPLGQLGESISSHQRVSIETNPSGTYFSDMS